MLHKETVEARTLDLLNKLSQLDLLAPYYLAGGTALALQIGHRLSIDLDFFGKIPVDYDELLKQSKEFGTIQVIDREDKHLEFSLNNVKIDVVNYDFKLIKPLKKVDYLKLASMEDIAAMKISAIEGRGTKKDFYDLYFLLESYSLKEILNFAKAKFPEANMLNIARSLVDFTDAENEPEPNLLSKKLNWDEVKDKIINKTKELV